jgi:hypothetical protein
MFSFPPLGRGVHIPGIQTMEDRAMSKPTTVSFKGTKRNCSTSKEAYIWLIDKVFADNPNLREISPQGRGRRYFARTRQELFPARRDLAENRNNYEPVSGGWFANTNLNNELKFQILTRLAKLAGFKFGEDWTWDVLADKSEKKRQTRARNAAGKKSPPALPSAEQIAAAPALDLDSV